MAFVCTANTDSWHADVFKRGSSFLVNVPVGYDNENGKDLNYFVSVALEPMAGGGGDMEYVFRLVEVDGVAKDEREFRSGRDVSAIISREDRAAILRVVLAATRSLILHATPDKVFMNTYDAYPPDSALVKYEAILTIFKASGYRVETSDPYHGRRCWWMERHPAASTS